jgi:hypothetical protein
MALDKKQAALTALLQEEQQLRTELSKNQESQRKLVFASLAVAGAIGPAAVLGASRDGQEFKMLVSHAMIVLSALETMVIAIYIGLSVGIGRIADYLLGSLHPRINELMERTDNDLFRWELWLRAAKRKSFFDYAAVSLSAFGEVMCLGTLAMVYHISWLYLAISSATFGWLHAGYLALVTFIMGLVFFIAAGTIGASRDIRVQPAGDRNADIVQ